VVNPASSSSSSNTQSGGGVVWCDAVHNRSTSNADANAASSKLPSKSRSTSSHMQQKNYYYTNSAMQMLGKLSISDGPSANYPTAAAAATTTQRYAFEIDASKMAHVLLKHRVAYGVVCTPNTPESVTTGLLATMRRSFENEFDAEEIAQICTMNDAAATASTRSFLPTLQNLIDSTPTDAPLNEVKSHIAEVKQVMTDNIEKVLARGEQLEVVAAKADNLTAHARDFHIRGRSLRRRMWWKEMKYKLLIALAIILLLLIIFFWACGGVKCVT